LALVLFFIRFFDYPQKRGCLQKNSTVVRLLHHSGVFAT